MARANGFNKFIIVSQKTVFSTKECYLNYKLLSIVSITQHDFIKLCASNGKTKYYLCFESIPVINPCFCSSSVVIKTISYWTDLNDCLNQTTLITFKQNRWEVGGTPPTDMARGGGLPPQTHSLQFPAAHPGVLMSGYSGDV